MMGPRSSRRYMNVSGEFGAEASVIFVPAPHAKEAAFEALEAGIRTLVMVTEHVPAVGHGPHRPVCPVDGGDVHRSELAWNRHSGRRSSSASCPIPYSCLDRSVSSLEAVP